MIKKKYPTDGSEIVLLTDGEDNTIGSCFDLVKKSGAIIHTVALGPAVAKELEQLSTMTGKGRCGDTPMDPSDLRSQEKWDIERQSHLSQVSYASPKWPLELTLPIRTDSTH